MNLVKICKERFKTLKPPTKVCKICFQEIKKNTPFTIVSKDPLLCENCYQSLVLNMKNFCVNHIGVTTLYLYDEILQSLIYQFKGCYDYELKDVFLERYKNELTLIYNGFTIIPVPSYDEDDKKRGFNHVEEIFKCLNLPILKLIRKTAKFKQAEHNQKERKNISKYLEIVKGKDIKNKKILLVDDVYTTGSTIKACLQLLKPLKPNKIKVLVLCKTPTKDINT